MGLFGKLFEKKECSICGGEIGLLGNRKLEDGNCCKNCAKKLSPWFEERRHSTVVQIREQLAYREKNARDLADFQVTRTIGEAYKMYIEEVDGVPTRFFVTDAKEYMEKNPDIIAFQDVVSCVTDIEKRREEIKHKDSDGNMVSYSPPRYKVHHDFFIHMDIRNNPYFSHIRFYVNRGVVTLEITEGGFFGGLFGGSRTGGIGSAREEQRFNEYENMCKTIEQAVQDGKMGAFAQKAAPAAAPAPAEPAAPPRPKFCTNCGAPAEGGKFCQSCGSPL